MISFASDKYYRNYLELEASAKKFGVSETYCYKPSDLEKTAWYKEHQSIFQYTRGFGFWLWKPYIIHSELAKLKDGEVLIYIDARSKFIQDIHPLIALAKDREVILFDGAGHKNSTYTKRDCFVLMDCDTEEFHTASNMDASIQLYKKGAVSMQFTRDYLRYGENIDIIGDLPNKSGKSNLPDFIIHQSDQSILSLLAKKYNIFLFRGPDQYGNHKKKSEYRHEGEFLLMNYHANPAVESDYDTIIQSKNDVIPHPFRRFWLSVKRTLKQLTK